MIGLNAALAVAYYHAMSQKNLLAVAECLHPNVELLSPVGAAVGKDAFLEGAKRFMSIFDNLRIRTHFETSTQAMVVYDVDCHEPIGTLRSAALLDIRDGLIARVELFFDARPLERK